jgi:hypothetical protein
MADRKLAEENNKLAEEMLNTYSRLADEIFADVAQHFIDGRFKRSTVF